MRFFGPRLLRDAVVGAVVAVGTGVALMALTLPDGLKGWRYERAARGSCRDFILEDLMAPGTASFVDTAVERVRPDYYRVRGAVDADNVFGAYVRRPYVCEVEIDDARDRIRLKRLELIP